jgi:nicotinamidase-related amidase
MKHKHTLTKSKTGLLVIDMQEKFAPVITDFEACVTNTAKLVLTFQMFNMPVIVTEQYPEGLGETVEKIRKQFTMLEVVEKIELAATDNEHFMEKVNKLGLETFVVCGIETHVCVNQTVLGLCAMGKTVHVVADAVGSRHSIDHITGLRKMENAGAIVTTTETVMFELAERAGTESFKNIQMMVKGQKAKNVPGGPKPSRKQEQRTSAVEKKAAEAPVKPAITESKGIPAAPPPAPVPQQSVEPAPIQPAMPGETEEVDLVDLALAAAAKDMRGKEAVPPVKAAPSEKKQETGGAPKGVTHSSSDIDSGDAVDIDEMLAAIDAKVDSQEPIGPVSGGLDKDIADLEDMMKADDKKEKELPDKS